MKFPLRTASAASQNFFYVVFPFSFVSIVFDSFFDQMAVQLHVFNLNMCEFSSLFFLKLISSFIPLWLEKMLAIISIFLKRQDTFCDLLQRMSHVHLTRTCIPLLVDGVLCPLSASGLKCHLSLILFYFIFVQMIYPLIKGPYCDLAISPFTFTLYFCLLSCSLIFPFTSVNIYFIYLGAHFLGAQIIFSWISTNFLQVSLKSNLLTEVYRDQSFQYCNLPIIPTCPAHLPSPLP